MPKISPFNQRKGDGEMKELRISKNDVVKWPSIAEPLYITLIQNRLKSNGFDLTKPIEEKHDMDTHEIVYTQN